MRFLPSLLLALLAAAPPLAAQVPALAGWRLGGGVDVLRFGHVAVSDAAAGVAAELRPSTRLGLYLGVDRSVGAWLVSAEAGWASGHIEAHNDILSIEDLTADVSRYRLALGVGRRLALVGPAALGLELAPTVDLWNVDGESRVRAGAEGRLVLRVLLGSVDLEHRFGFGVSASPIETQDVGAGADERGLRTLLIGLGLRTRL